MSKIYCGNNKKSPKLTTMRRGTKYECLKKGVGTGLRMPLDEDFLGEFAPIDKRKMYCGNKTKLPRGYSIMGSGPKCLAKGVGIGKRIRAERGDGSGTDSMNNESDDNDDGYSDDGYSPNHMKINMYLYVSICIIWSISLFIYLYVRKPNFIIEKRAYEKTYEKTKKIHWIKFSIIYIIACIIFALCVYFLMKSLNH